MPIVLQITTAMKPLPLVDATVTTTEESTTTAGILDHLENTGASDITLTITDPDGDVTTYTLKTARILEAPIPYTKLAWKTASGTSSMVGLALIPKAKNEKKGAWAQFL